MSYTVEQLDPSQWDQWNRFVIEHPYGSFLQTTMWAQQKAHFGWTAAIQGIWQDRQLVGGALVLSRRLPLGQHLNYIAYAPLIDSHHIQALSPLLDHLKTFSLSAIVLKIDSPWSTHHSQTSQVAAIFNQAGYRFDSHMQQPEHTLVLDLTKSTDQLMADMRQTTRRYIRQVQKSDLIIEHAPSEAYLDQFYQVMEQVGQRKKFGVHTHDYYRQVSQAFSQSSQASTHIFLVKQADQLLGAYFLIRLAQRSWELYGGLTDQGQNLKAGYLLKWRAIQTMKDLGVTRYDQWGIAPPDSPHHPLAGVTYFKQGFAGQSYLYQGSWSYSARPILYALAKWTGKV